MESVKKAKLRFGKEIKKGDIYKILIGKRVVFCYN